MAFFYVLFRSAPFEINDVMQDYRRHVQQKQLQQPGKDSLMIYVRRMYKNGKSYRGKLNGIVFRPSSRLALLLPQIENQSKDSNEMAVCSGSVLDCSIESSGLIIVDAVQKKRLSDMPFYVTCVCLLRHFSCYTN